MKIKICGLNPTRDVQTCIDLYVHFLGFVFYDKSPRNTDLKEISILKDGWTVVTKDKKASAHYEHMVLINENGCEVLTMREEVMHGKK